VANRSPFFSRAVLLSSEYASCCRLLRGGGPRKAPSGGSLADCGIDILNPLEPLAATDWPAIKKEYGHRICFMGGVDLKQALRGWSRSRYLRLRGDSLGSVDHSLLLQRCLVLLAQLVLVDDNGQDDDHALDRPLPE
jgi:hypothetical protein